MPATVVGVDDQVEAEQAPDGSWRQVIKIAELPSALQTSLGATTDAESASGNASMIAALKRIRSLLNKPNTGAFAGVSVTTTNTTILASNSARLAYKLWNRGSVDIYIAEGFTATLTNFSYVLAAGGGFSEAGVSPFTGAINGITASGSANVNTTSYTYV